MKLKDFPYEIGDSVYVWSPARGVENIRPEKIVSIKVEVEGCEVRLEHYGAARLKDLYRDKNELIDRLLSEEESRHQARKDELLDAMDIETVCPFIEAGKCPKR